MTTTEPAPAPVRQLGDRLFAGTARAAGVLILVILAAVAAFLVWRSIPSLRENTASFLTTRDWAPNGTKPAFGILSVVFGTLLSAFIALVIATPVAVGVALFISHYAPRRLASPLGYVVDLLAAVPSVVYGLWGIAFLIPHVRPFYVWLSDTLGWIPLFAGPVANPARTILTAGIVLAIMILPIISSISHEVFLQVPRTHVEAALALGATRWEVVRIAVIPFGRPGVISAAMLGLGRALGETIAVTLVLSPAFLTSFHVLQPGNTTIAANIALGFFESGPTGISALIASGLVLFVITLAVNSAARAVIARRKEFSGAAS